VRVQGELRRKSFDILRHLVENGSRLISKGEFVSAVWQKVIVTDELLASCISDVRAPSPTTSTRSSRRCRVAAIIFTADVNRHEYADPRRQQAGAEAVTEHVLAERPSIAVLAFTNNEWRPGSGISDGITEDIITELSRFSELLVIPRNSSFRYKSRSLDVR